MLPISNVDEFRKAIASREEIREADLGDGLTSFCYMIAGHDTFSIPEARECRGIVFGAWPGYVGGVVGRPFHKFFNLGERPETQANVLPWDKVVRVMDKRDGSMIHTVQLPGGIRLKSKKSFESEVAKAATVLAHGDKAIKDLCFQLAMEENATAIFEYTAPDARIVLYYPKAELKLLNIRDNVSGRYWHPSELHEVASKHGVGVVDEVNDFWSSFAGFAGRGDAVMRKKFNYEKMIAEAETREGIEGWVVQFENGDMVKVKTKWYLARHRVMTFMRERDIAEMVLNETIDDVKSLLVAEGVDINEILALEKRVVNDLLGVKIAAEQLQDMSDWQLDRKSFAIKHAGTPLFGLRMTKFLGKEPDYKDYFIRNRLKEKYTLRQLNLMPSVAEAE